MLVRVLFALTLALPSAAQEKPEWVTAVESMDHGFTKQLIPAQELIIGELAAQKKIAAEKKDAARLPRLNACIRIAEQRLAGLKKGQIDHPGRHEAEWQAFLLAAAGRTWSLERTRNVKSLHLDGCLLERLSAEGTKTADDGERSAIPGLFPSKRSDANLSCYLISPDLQQSRCFITYQLFEGISAATEPAQGVQKPVTIAAGFDLLPALEAKYGALLLRHEKQLLRVLETHLRRADERQEKATSTAIRARLAQAQAAIEHLEATAQKAMAEDGYKDFWQRAKQRHWVFPGVNEKLRLHVDEKWVRSTDASGKELEVFKVAEVIWPGLLRFEGPKGIHMALVISADLRTAIFMPYTTLYEGKLLEKK